MEKIDYEAFANAMAYEDLVKEVPYVITEEVIRQIVGRAVALGRYDGYHVGDDGYEKLVFIHRKRTSKRDFYECEVSWHGYASSEEHERVDRSDPYAVEALLCRCFID